ncbi:MAG: group II intron reverse transcriptase/maturase [Atopobiaceae bacterium]|nr:group II intron reverse transcriptase/maturase [Atopobiaceae bacterium]
MGAIEGRQLRIEFEGQPGRAGAEPPEHPEAPTRARSIEADELDARTGNTDDLLERICSWDNMSEACARVVRNGGAGGVDGMGVAELPAWLEANHEALAGRILSGRYRPRPVRRVEIPKKEKGKVRLLGIPTCVDRLVQQAVAQQLTPIFEPRFHPDSYGFRPGRSAHDALLAVKRHADAGSVWVASMDLERFFDTVNQSKLVQLLSDALADKRVVSLVHRFLMAGVAVDGIVEPTEEGTPQGGPLSPLLANVLLDELDWELERRGHAFVRYADDFMILKRSRKAAERAMGSMARFVESKLFLKVNRDKSFVARITGGVRYLGYGFYPRKGELRFRVHPKSLALLKDGVREILSRSNGWSLDWRRHRLRCLANGWAGYFRLADMREALRNLDMWVRRKIRCVYWKCWKLPRTKLRALARLGVAPEQAWQWANSRKSFWRIAGSPVLGTALNNSKLEELGWALFYPRYLELQC